MDLNGDRTFGTKGRSPFGIRDGKGDRPFSYLGEKAIAINFYSRMRIL
ncbi:hypothetical protein QUB70_00450 [Microcoleus sp. A003_D6]